MTAENNFQKISSLFFFYPEFISKLPLYDVNKHSTSAFNNNKKPNLRAKHREVPFFKSFLSYRKSFLGLAGKYVRLSSMKN